jgi:glycosyltransferase involved in cell wall biosynthesis
MRIAHVTATFPPYYAGTGMVAYHNALELARLGHQVTVFTAAYPSGQFHDPPEITVRRFHPLFRIGNAPLLPGLLGLKDFDLIHLHHPFIFGTELIWAVSKLRNIPVVLTHHNDLIGDGLRKTLFQLYSSVSTRLIFHQAKKFAVVSLDHARGCRLSGFFARRWADVIEVPNGVDHLLFQPGLASGSARASLGISAEKKIILFVGGLDRAHHFKGADLLIKAFARLESPDTVLVLIGDGDLRLGLEQLAAQLGISERVFFPGSIPNEQLPPFYCMADGLVLPSIPPESFGMVLIEAMACGIPVIASNLPGVRSVVSDGVDGYLFEPGSLDELVARLSTLLSDPGVRAEMGMRGRCKVEQKYTWPVVTARLEQVYRLALQK